MPEDKKPNPTQPLNPTQPSPRPVRKIDEGIGDSAPAPSRVQPTQEWPRPEKKGG
jgi:hypothetical protein